MSAIRVAKKAVRDRAPNKLLVRSQVKSLVTAKVKKVVQVRIPTAKSLRKTIMIRLPVLGAVCENELAIQPTTRLKKSCLPTIGILSRSISKRQMEKVKTKRGRSPPPDIIS